MFQRRLALLLVLLGAAGLPPALQVARLGVVKADEYAQEAERRLVDQQWLATVRGRILDRKGRELAADRPTFDVAFEYPVITGRWAQTQARRKARRVYAGVWPELSLEERDERVAEFLPEFNQRLDAMWDRVCAMAGVSRADLDDRRAEIRHQVDALAVSVVEAQRKQMEERLNRGAEAFEEVTTAQAQRPVAEQVASHVVLSDVPDEVGFAFERAVKEAAAAGLPPESQPFPGLSVINSVRREYPLDGYEVAVDTSSFPGPLRRNGVRTVRVSGVAPHVLGWMRKKLYKEDLERRPLRRADGTLDYGHYRPGDSVGQSGVEAAAEDELRGLRGLRKTHLDTRVQEEDPARHGRDVHLTLDAALQARVQSLFEPALGLAVVQEWHKSKRPPPEEGKPRPKELPLGTPLNGAVVVIEVDSGDILAMASVPSLSHEWLGEASSEALNDPVATPLVNRATEKPYPPGSIVKPLVLCGATTSGKYGGSEGIDCTGHFFPDKPLLYRCWIYKQFHNTHTQQLGHAPNGAEAIEVSCNIFFFELGRRLGPKGVFDWYHKFGVAGEKWNLYGFPALTPARLALLPREAGQDGKPGRPIDPNREFAGSLPNPERASVSDAVLLGIGQGPIAWTPLHAADAYSTLARGGVRITPRLRADARQERLDLGLSRSAVAQALEGLRRSASEDLGTTHHVKIEMPDGTTKKEIIFDTPGVAVWAKSGTADTKPFEADLNSDGENEQFDGDHAWCVFLCGPEGERPQYAVAVVVDHAGSGGRVAGPLGNQVVRALVEEGYLPKVQAAPGNAEDERARSASDGSGASSEGDPSLALGARQERGARP